jgi:hypothetical protein
MLIDVNVLQTAELAVETSAVAGFGVLPVTVASWDKKALL